jgi:TonB-linked SusC/RagA family outer membrane protein
MVLLLTALTADAQEMRGRVLDEHGEALPGVTIRLVRTRPRHEDISSTVTDVDGRFRLHITEPDLFVSANYMGFQGNTIRAVTGKEVVIRLKPDVHELKETFVTGYYQKAKNSFTGTATQVSGEELRQVNTNSLLDGLKVFDPSFQVVDTRGLFGSDPNHLPDQIEIRGQNTMPDISQSSLQSQPSLPIFILDGFEVSVQKIYDLDVNRVRSITLLKDASASAVYGSRAANGVVVIETRTPDAGRLQVSYTLNGGVELPDLSSYNLMNAAEALEFQRLAGVFDSRRSGEDPGTNLNSYNAVRRAVLSGQDTYWLSKPLRSGVRHKHSLMVDGTIGGNGQQASQMRFSVNLGYGSQQGVMRGSDRQTYEAGGKLLFHKGRLYVTNDLQLSMVTSTESPYGIFSAYTAALPYYSAQAADGTYYRQLSIANLAPAGMSLGVTASQQSPLYEAKYLNSYSTGRTMSVTDNLSLNLQILHDIRLRGRFSFSYDYGRQDAYVSPGSFSYINNSNESVTPDVLYKRGRYDVGNSSGLTYYGSLVATFSHSYDRWDVQSIVGGELRQARTETDGYAVTGSLGDAQDYLSYAVQYQQYGRPSGTEATVRSAGVFCNQNWAYDNRYLCDLTCRLDGSSLYGRSQQTAPYWSVGLRWNAHNEHFLHGRRSIGKLALRANIGTTGNQGYSRNQAQNMYSYMTQVYGGHFGALITTLGNPELKGQRTFNRNIGLEGTFFDRRLNFEVNAYYNTTKGSLTSLTIAPSLGFESYKANMGDLSNSGLDFNLSYTPIRTRDVLLSFTLNGTHNTNRIRKISDALQRYNDMVSQQVQNDTRGEYPTVFLFREGESMNTIYAVRSLGIDPGTGKEIFLTADGETTYEWNARDQVPVGVNEPTLQGYFGVNFRWHGWEAGTHVNYSFGADKYNYTLHQKIENVSYMQNNDRRALTERWHQPGDVARYKAVTDNSATRATSRFVQQEQRLSMTSLRLAYTVPAERLRHTWLSMLRLSLTANELFYVSTIRQERGLSYPFARSVTFTAQVNF